MDAVFMLLERNAAWLTLIVSGWALALLWQVVFVRSQRTP
jgi:hypothetical protein